MATAVETMKNFINVLTDYSQDTSEIGRIALDDAIRKTTIFPSLKDAVKDTLRLIPIPIQDFSRLRELLSVRLMIIQ